MPGVVTGDGDTWWPDGCGRPNSTGAQNDMRYACFPETRRLAVQRGDRVELYDTGEHRVHGVSQQQGSGYDLRFTSQLGTVDLDSLKRIDLADAEPPSREAERSDLDPASGQEVVATPAPRSSGVDPLDMLERLHALHRKGVLSEAEFAEKKKELLARI